MTDTERGRLFGKIRMGEVDECWEWQGGKHKGYGTIDIGGRTCRAHRLVLELKLGRPIKPGHYACHSCDNPGCCNPGHLFEKTPKGNSEDAVSRKRHSHGDRAARHLTEEKVKQVWQLARSGNYTMTGIALQFDIQPQLVSAVLAGRIWKHLYEGVDGRRLCLPPKRLEQQHGEQHHRAKLTEVDVLWIRETYASGAMCYRELADAKGVGIRTVGHIVTGRLWAHLPILPNPVLPYMPNRKGAANSSAKLSEAEVAQIREKYATGRYTQTALATEYGVRQSTIWSIVRGKGWTETGAAR